MQREYPTVSLVIPVYGVERFLDACMESVLQQTYKNLEVILVDDGSLDRCPQMCDDYARSDDRIKVIHKANAGLGMARNSGVKMATGEYILFLDPDDYIALNTVEKVVDKLEESKADIVYFHSCKVLNGKIIEYSRHWPDDCEKEEIFQKLLPISICGSIQKKKDGFTLGSACSGGYRIDFLKKNNIWFESERKYICEDLLFTTQALVSADKVGFLDEILYFYRFNPRSLSNSYRSDRLEGSISLYEKQLKMIREYGLGEEAFIRAMNLFLINLIVCLKQEVYRDKWEVVGNKLDEISRCEHFRSIYNEYPLKKLDWKRHLLFFCLYNRWIFMVWILIKVNSKQKLLRGEETCK